MKIFVSWSGTLSREIAEILKKWIPCILQHVDMFFSPEDIEKGADWNKKLSTELCKCNYGIICLTTENINAPWINFEAGAIAKSPDSKISVLMINLKPADITGPLHNYQATAFEKKEFFRLISSINTTSDSPLQPNVLKNTFDSIWPRLNREAQSAIQNNSKNALDNNKYLD